MRQENLTMLHDTLSILENGSYKIGDRTVSLKLNHEQMKEAIVYLPDDVKRISQSSGLPHIHASERCRYNCINTDSFTLARKRTYEFSQIENEQKPVLVLNLANSVHPGGGVRRGAKAQEEDLCRKSSLLISLESKQASTYYDYNRSLHTDMGSNAVMIHPNVEIIKDENGNLLQDSVIVAVMTCAAPHLRNGQKDKPPQYEAMMYERITGMLKIAAFSGYTHLILGAFGCGAFNNDAKTVSDLFYRALKEFDFDGMKESDLFRTIDFAVMDHSPNQYNFREFSRNFSLSYSEPDQNEEDQARRAGNKGSIQIKKISITDLDTDAIVNAANDGLWVGDGVCGAIFKAAGHDKLQAACNKIGHCNTGSAVITPGFDLKAKYIIHAVGPRWTDGKHDEPQLLYSAYWSSLELAVKNGCRSIGFPLISSGIFGYPVEQAWRKALQACRDFLAKGNQIDIVFAVLSSGSVELGRKTLKEIAPQMVTAVKSDWQTSEMPSKHDHFTLDRSFTPDQMKALRKGNIPQEMEDKWFWYMEGDTLFAHRSWTGFCIYRIDFSPNNHHKVTVNRDPEQYECTSVDEDRDKLNKLLNWWTEASYDYYVAWLSETVDSMKKAGMIKDKLKVAGQEVDAVFFHLPYEPHGFLSNWYPSPFDLDGVHFTSAEQYIMYRKCMIFGDTDSAQKVLATEDTKKQQAIGRNAKGYVGSVWSGMRQLVAVRGLLAKFSQNDDLKKMLLDTGDAWLVECAHSDTTWACGIRLNEEERFDSSKWRGQNILGFALMEVRSILRKADN